MNTTRKTREQVVRDYVEQIMEDIQGDWLPGLAYTRKFTERELDDMVTDALDRLIKALRELKAEHLADIEARREED